MLENSDKQMRDLILFIGDETSTIRLTQDYQLNQPILNAQQQHKFFLGLTMCDLKIVLVQSGTREAYSFVFKKDGINKVN
jgi:hypothetical protein